MGFISKLGKAGLAKKGLEEARKPENQRKIKDAVSSIRSKRGAKGPQPPR